LAQLGHIVQIEREARADDGGTGVGWMGMTYAAVGGAMVWEAGLGNWVGEGAGLAQGED